MSFTQNGPELEAAYLASYPMEKKDIPADAVFLGTVEALAFTVEIYQDGDGTFVSCVQEK